MVILGLISHPCMVACPRLNVTNLFFVHVNKRNNATNIINVIYTTQSNR